MHEASEPAPLLVDISQCSPEWALGLDVAPPLGDPRPQFGDQRGTFTLPSFEPLRDGLSRALGLGVHMEDLGEELQANERALIAAARGFYQLAPRVCVTAAAVAASSLDAVVRC